MNVSQITLTPANEIADMSTRELLERIDAIANAASPEGMSTRTAEIELATIAFALARRLLTQSPQDRADEDWVLSIANEYRIRADREQAANPDGIWPKFFRDRASQIERTCRRWGVLGA